MSHERHLRVPLNRASPELQNFRTAPMCNSFPRTHNFASDSLFQLPHMQLTKSVLSSCPLRHACQSVELFARMPVKGRMSEKGGGAEVNLAPLSWFTSKHAGSGVGIHKVLACI